MTLRELELAVGIREAARLIILKGKMSDELAERFAPARKEEENDLNPSGGLMTFVVRVTTWTNHTNVIEFNCGHSVVLAEDETNHSLIGAEVACDQRHYA